MIVMWQCLQGTASSLYNQHVTEQEAIQEYAMALSHPETGIACQELQSGMRVFNGTLYILIVIYTMLMY